MALVKHCPKHEIEMELIFFDGKKAHFLCRVCADEDRTRSIYKFKNVEGEFIQVSPDKPFFNMKSFREKVRPTWYFRSELRQGVSIEDIQQVLVENGRKDFVEPEKKIDYLSDLNEKVSD